LSIANEKNFFSAVWASVVISPPSN